jgi:hypothetical protein
MGTACRIETDSKTRSSSGVGFGGPANLRKTVKEVESTSGAAHFSDGSAAATPWPETSDIDAIALGQPGLSLQLATGIGFLTLVGWRRR